MKKFTKVSLVIAAVLAGVGLLLCGIASFMGGNRTIRQMADDGELIWGNWHIGSYGLYYREDDADVGAGDIDAVGTDTDTVWTSCSFDASLIENLKLDVNAAVVDVREGSDAQNVVVRFSHIRESDYDNKVESGTLIIEYDKRHHFVTDNYAEIVVEIPEGMQFDTVELDVGAADADIEGLSCRDLTLSVGAGELTTSGFTVTERMTVSLGAGSLSIGGGSYGDVKLECGVGELSMAGTVDGNLTAECGVGEMEIELRERSEEDYNYNIHCGMGEVNVNGESYSDISGSYQATNSGAVGTINLDCGMGSIDVEISST